MDPSKLNRLTNPITEQARITILRRALIFLGDPFPGIPLSNREKEVAVLLARGLTRAEIAEQLHITVPTVKTHAKRITKKVGMPARKYPARTIQKLERFIREAIQDQPSAKE